MATHSSIPAWKIPGTEEPGGLQSMETHTHTYPHQSSLPELHTVSPISLLINFSTEEKGPV